MKEFIVTEKNIVIKNRINAKRLYVVLPILIAIALGILFHFNPKPTLDLFFQERPTMQVPVCFIALMLSLLLLIVHSTTFDGSKKQLVKHTIFGTRKVCDFDEISEINRLDEYTNTNHSRVFYQIILKEKEYKKGINLCSFFPYEQQEIKNFEEKILPLINLFIKK